MRRYLLCSAVLALLSGLAFGANTIVGWDFEQGLDGWQTPDPQAQLGLAVGRNQAVQGSAALHLKFARIKSLAETQQRGLPGALFLNLPAPPTPAPTCLEFDLRTTLRTPLMLVATEEDGSQYRTMLTVAPGDWRHVKLYLDSFSLDEKSTDEDLRLDGDQIDRLLFADASFFLVGLGEAGARAGFATPVIDTGENEIWLDDVKLTDEPAAKSQDLLTDASGSVLKAIAVMNPAGTLTRLPNGLAGKPCWKLSYDLGERQIAAVSCPTGRLAFPGSAGINIALEASAHTVLVIQVKEQDGSEYNTLVELQPGQPEIRQIPWPDFKLAQNSTDENGQLDVDQIKEVNLVDGTNAFGGGAPHQNTLLLGALTAAK